MKMHTIFIVKVILKLMSYFSLFSLPYQRDGGLKFRWPLDRESKVKVKHFSLFFRMFVDAVENIPAHVQVKQIFRCSVQEVRGLDQLWPQGVKPDIRRLQLPVVPLRQGLVASPYCIIQSMGTDGLLNISIQHLIRYNKI